VLIEAKPNSPPRRDDRHMPIQSGVGDVWFKLMPLRGGSIGEDSKLTRRVVEAYKNADFSLDWDSSAAALHCSKHFRIASRRGVLFTSTKRHGSLSPTEGARHAIPAKRSSNFSGRLLQLKRRTSRRHTKRLRSWARKASPNLSSTIDGFHD